MGLFKEELNNIRAFVFDIDGVLAESQVVLHPSGDLMRTMNTKDGYAMMRAVEEGFPVCVISGARSRSLIDRFTALGISEIYLDSKDKVKDLYEFTGRYSIDLKSVLYMGDDLPDIAAMRIVGMPTCPLDAAEEVQGISDYISNYPGGHGCVRDIIEQVLRAQGKWYKNGK